MAPKPPQIKTRMTGTAWRQGATNALICGAGVLLAWLALAFVFSFEQAVDDFLAQFCGGRYVT